MNMEKMKKVFSNEEFVKSLFAMENAAEVQAALKEKGVEMTEEEVKAMIEFFAKVKSGEISRAQLEQWVAQAESGELSEELLEQVAGGFVGMAIGFGAIMAFLFVSGISLWCKS